LNLKFDLMVSNFASKINVLCRYILVREGLHYNPYFPGGAIAMPKMLVDGGAVFKLNPAEP
jgi:hypothetical protein